ncbi:MAG: nitroreductase [Deltaproteobacteria bacterium]|nr:nitroreductase [Deltaproteobacteria bacterium]
MDIHTAMTTRRTIHYWKPLPVPEDVVTKALEAAHMAPCHRYTWPWRFNRVGAQSRAKIFDLALQIKQGKRGSFPLHALEVMKRKMQNPAVLIVVSMINHEDDFTDQENYAAVSCAIQNMALSFHASGYGSKWSTGKVTRDKLTYEILNIHPQEERIVGFIWAGVPESTPRAPTRPDVEEYIRIKD